jgi:hypothetical protein
MEKGNANRALVGKPEGRRPLEDLTADARILLKCILRNAMEGCELHLSHERNQWPGSCEHGNETLVQ